MARETARMARSDLHALPGQTNELKERRMPPLQDLLRHGRNVNLVPQALNRRPLLGRRNPPAAEIATKSRQTVSAAGLFKKKLRTSGRKKRYTRKDASPESTLLGAFKEGLHEARSNLLANSEATFIAVHGDFTDQLAHSHASGETFLAKLSNDIAILGAPLAREQIETTFTRDGKRGTEVIEIGRRIAQFKNSVEQEEAKLRESWKLWEQLQEEYIELGTEVLGAKDFQVSEGEGRGGGKGFLEEITLMNLEKETRRREFVEHIEDNVRKILERMKSTEKELDALTKRERAKLLQALVEE